MRTLSYPDLLEYSTSFSLSEDALDWLAGFCADKQPKMILELGSGLSTAVLAFYLKHSSEPKPRALSLEHSEKWSERTYEMLDDLDLLTQVERRYSPLRPRFQSGGALWYSAKVKSLWEYTNGEGFDLILVDGPPGSVGRGACVPVLSGLLHPGTVILFDDVHRAEEGRILADWQRRDPRLRRVETIKSQTETAILVVDEDET